MSLIKIHVLTQEIDLKVEIITHELLKIYNISDYSDNLITIRLPCPLDKIQIVVGSAFFNLELFDSQDVDIYQCVKCHNINTKKLCICYEDVKHLKMHVTYISNANISYCSKETLDILLRTIQYTYISTVKEKTNRRSSGRQFRFVDSAALNETLYKTGKYFNLRDTSHYWVIDKQFRNYRSYSQVWIQIVSISGHIMDSICNLKFDILNIFGFGVQFFKRLRNESKRKTEQPSQDCKESVLSEYLLYIYKYLSIILNYSNDEVLDMIRVILGLSHDTVNQKNILKVDNSSFEFYVYKRSHKIINTDLDKTYENLINIDSDKLIDIDKLIFNDKLKYDKIEHGNIEDDKFKCLYNGKLNIINFICSLHKKFKSQHSNQVKIRLKNMQLDFTQNKYSIYKSKSHSKISISGESLFTNDKLVAFYLDTVKIHRSQNKPLQLTFENDKGKLQSYLYKENSDLSLDIFFNSLTEYIYEVIECPYKLYNLLMISQQTGIIEMKQGRLISTFESVEQLKRYLVLCEEDYTVLTSFDQHKGFSKSRMDNFLKSLAISILTCYLFEIRDRTSSNILIDNEGKVFHIDYEYTLGSSPSYLNPEIEIPSLISHFLKSDTLILNKFYHLLSNYYKVIRDNYLKILMMSKILTTNRPTYFNQNRFEKMFLAKLHLEVENSIAEEIMMKSFNKSLGSFKTKIKEFLACIKREITT